MNLTSFGCSFIFGSDLADAEMIPGTPGQPSEKSWPALVAQHFQRKYHCRAYPGCGNLLIAERILLDLKHKIPTNQFYIIGWTWIDRFDYNDPNKTDNWNTLHPSGTDTVEQSYYRDLHSEYADKLRSLITIKAVIDTLNQQGILFLMTNMDKLLFDKSWNTSTSVDYLQDYVRPYMTDFEGMTFLEWSRHHGFAESPGWHPLEQAHQAAADYIIKAVDKQKIVDPVPQARV